MTPAGVRRSAAAMVRRLPWSAELYQRWGARGQPPGGGYRLDRLAAALPAWTAAAWRTRTLQPQGPTRRVMVFAYLSWWLEHASALSLVLSALGHEVLLAFLPYRRWTEDPAPFDARRQSAYLANVLRPLRGRIRLMDASLAPGADIPQGLAAELERQSSLDVQYTLQREDVALPADPSAASLYGLRLRRNRTAASAALRRLEAEPIDNVVVPNGSILEFGAVYRAARFRGVSVTTYEFGEQRERMWLAQNSQVMRQDTSDLWRARGTTPLTTSEGQRLEAMYGARRGGGRWDNFARQWQPGASEGAAAARQRLGLDPRKPAVLVCTNVVGDSLALDRQIFTLGMADWLAETVRRLAERSDVQTIVRVHPGEILGAGHPSQEIVRATLPEVPDSLHLIPPESPTNTYDLIELADLGIVYTSTVGLEMAMAGVPVIVAGATHYRGRGFTYDPASLAEYGETLERLLREPTKQRLSQEKIELAQRYAYRFFFEYPFRYPWHLIGFWDDISNRSPETTLLPTGLEPYRRTAEALTGVPIDWAGAEIS